MANRYSIRAEKTEGGWRLVVFEPTRQGHHRVGPVEGTKVWKTRKEAEHARKEGVRWCSLKFTNGRCTERTYSYSEPSDDF
jgi:hypothetical protein